jgi:2-polyprenyl-6-hydroxyphenyl methylase/3-demethylubiquinone-9 3-methyltransferase
MLATLSPGRVLDVGCHGGRFTQEVVTRYPSSRISGIDMSQHAIRYAKKRNPKVDFRVARAESLPYKNGSFDLVTCFEVLEHVEDPVQVVGEMRRVLSPQGYIMMLVPSENWLFRLVWFFWTRFGPGRVWHHTHVQKFHHETLDTLLSKNGFRIIRRKLFIFGMLLLILAQKDTRR